MGVLNVLVSGRLFRDQPGGHESAAPSGSGRRRIVCLLLTAIIEGISRKKLNPKYEGYVHTAGMVLLLALMLFITFHDVFVLFTGGST